MPSRRELLGCLAITAVQSEALATSPDVPAVRSRFAFEVRVTVAAPLVVGSSSHGLRRVVPITGGNASGPRFKGRVIPGGADWQVIRPDGVLSVDAKYTLEAEDGSLIMVTNRGMRHGPAAVIDKLSRGEAVDASQYYFRTTAQFEAPLESKHAWLNRAIFIGVAERTANAAIIRFHELL